MLSRRPIRPPRSALASTGSTAGRDWRVRRHTSVRPSASPPAAGNSSARHGSMLALADRR